MPLIKRKPVELVPPPRRNVFDPDVPVFYIKETGEIFPEYDDYAQRLSFYRQSIFQCELSGRIHLTFFEAQKSERKQSALVHRSFPEALKGPILRSVQFYVTGRIDELVDLVFDRFKDRFFEEENVVLDIHGDRFMAAVRKIHPSRSLTKRREEEIALTTKGDNTLPRKATKKEGSEKEDGDASDSDLSEVPTEDKDQNPLAGRLTLKDVAHVIGTDLTRDESETQKEDHPIDDYLYSVQLLSADGEDDFSMTRMERRADSLTRDRLSFSKTILKKYLKECVVRDASVGSPWIVKPLLADKYGISMHASEDVEEKNRLIKEDKLIKRRKYLDEVTEDGQPATKKPRKSKAEEAKAEAERKEEEERRKADEKRKRMIKYPIEDLLLEPLVGIASEVKSEEKSDRKAEFDQQPRIHRPVPKTNLLPGGKELFEPLMNSYIFLQACGKALLLSPFHLDDFEAALQHDSHDSPCHLIGEIHATLLNVIVRDTSSSKALTEETAEAVLSDDEFDEEKNESGGEGPAEGSAPDDDEDEEEDELDELDSKASSIADSTVESGPDDVAEGDLVDGTKKENRLGEDVYAASRKFGRGWESKLLRSDNFREGWEYSLCGVLTKRATQDEFPRGLAILSHLTGVGNFAHDHDAKGDEAPSKALHNDLYQTPVQRYVSMSFRDKVLVLHFLCEQAVMTRTIKRFFDQCEHQLTELRKERVELGRARRKLADDRSTFEETLKRDSDEEGDEAADEEADANGRVERAAVEEEEEEEEEEDEEMDDDDDGPPVSNGRHPKKANGSTKGRSKSATTKRDDYSGGEQDELTSTGMLNSDDEYDSSATGDEVKYRRNFGSRQEAMRIKVIQREAEEAERLARLRQEREEQKTRMQENRQIAMERKRLDDEEARINKREEAIEREFRQHSQAPRLHPLGRDRFLDKYWWFDGVGAANLLGAHGQVQYSTGRLFVQGPSEEELAALAEEHAPGMDALLQRKNVEHSEEGSLGPDRWGVYTEPEEVDALITWLRAKGVREHALRQQMQRFRAYLQPGMQKRAHDLTGGWKDNVETRRSNRTKESAASRPPYMNYRNAFAKGVQ